MKFERKVNYYETDKMGIVHHSNYIRYAEEARIEFFDYIGIPYKDNIEGRNMLSPVLSMKCNYKHSATFNDILEIDVNIKEWNGVRITIEYIVKNKETGKLIANMESSHCFTDMNLKPLNLKKEHKDLYNIFMENIHN
ncbi:MAG: acyl-CoA thioesterase [Clostridia bacterium]|nr:acyl-CoA thioesterase [Clostridia bacterium]